MTQDWYWYEQNGEDTVRLLRMFGTSPEVMVPAEIAGKVVTEIADYCFSVTCKITSCRIISSNEEKISLEQFQEKLQRKELCELCGGYIEGVTLPKSIRSIGNYCFYQCSSLRNLSVGSSLTQIGSDAFMNCQKLQTIILRDGLQKSSGLKQILAQRPLEMTVVFMDGNKIQAKLLYPEYSETYDEIGPAHIFTLNIDGEGFRARQCFQDGKVDFMQYDTVFLQACAKESEKTLCYMAGMRLAYPVDLLQEHRENYEKYVRDHAVIMLRLLIEEQNTVWLQMFGEAGYFTREDVKQGVGMASASGWTEGAGMLLQYQSLWFGDLKKKKYDFDAF